MRRRTLAAALGGSLLGAAALTGCASASASSDDVVTIGYQSKTINTVTAGTLLRAQGYFEKQLDALGRSTGKHYKVEWDDYDTGAPITAQMLAGKIDIGSMGDYPLLINGSTLGTSADHGSSLVATTGYNLRGALNGVVVKKSSPITGLRDLAGKRISASVGSAGHGMLVQALQRAGIDPVKHVRVENQQPSVGAAALQSGTVDAVSQFVAWPGYLAWRDDDRLVYDGGALGVPTFHGVVVRNAYAADNPDIVNAFLKAEIQATDYLHQHPVQAAEKVAKATGLPAEVVYLYNGRDGISTFDTTLKRPLVTAFDKDVPFLKSIGVLTKSLDPTKFVHDRYIRKAIGASYDHQAASTANPAAITGTDTLCHRKVGGPAVAGEVWVRGERDTLPAATPECLLRDVAALRARGKQIRAAYVPDALTGTHWFADRSVWLRYGARLRPFATQDNADAYRKSHPGGTQLTWAQALAAVHAS